MEKKDRVSPFYAKDNEMRAILYNDMKDNDTEYSLADICFVCATTKSMDKYITEIKNTLIGFLNTADKLMITQPRVAFIEYKNKGDKHQIKSRGFTRKYEEMVEFIKGIKCEGGGNGCIDIVTPLMEALKLDWSSDSNYVLLIVDAPAHGKNYHTDKYPDDYPEDDKNRLLEKLASHYRKNKINLGILKCNESVDKMIKIFKKYYNSRANELNVADLKYGSKEDFIKCYFTGLSNLKEISSVDDRYELSAGDQYRNFRRVSEQFHEPEEIVGRNEMEFSTSFRGRVNTGSVQGLAFDRKEYNYSIKLMPSAEVKCEISTMSIGYGTFTNYYPLYIDMDTNYIAKIPRILAKKAEDLLPDIEGTLLTKVLTDKFNSLLRQAEKEYKGSEVERYSLRILPLSIIENLDAVKSKGSKFFLVQKLPEGEYIKFNNNYGWISDVKDPHNLIAQAFSHFTYEYTMGVIMVTDIQGIKSSSGDIAIIDPAIHSFVYNKRFGETNHGKLGMIKFFMTHKCNEYCKKLHLIHPNSIDYAAVKSIKEKHKGMEALNYLYKEFKSNAKDLREKIRSFDPNLGFEFGLIEKESDEEKSDEEKSDEDYEIHLKTK